MAKTTACLLYVLIGCAGGLAYTLESIVAKVNAIGAESSQVTAPLPPSEILMARVVTNEDAIDRSAIIVVQQEHIDLRGEGVAWEAEQYVASD